MAKRKIKKKVVKRAAVQRRRRGLTRPLAVVAFLLNVLLVFIPGIGSLVGGKTRAGIWQVALALIGIILSTTLQLKLLGLPVILVAWVWGIIVGVEMLRESE